MLGKNDSVSVAEKVSTKNDLVSIEEKIYRKILDSNKKNRRKKRKTSLTNTEILIAGSILAIALLFVIGAIYYYNVFIHLQYNLEANLAQIDTQLQKRKNLIINLGTTIVEYSKHEREIFNHVAELRTMFSGINSNDIPENIRNQLNANAPLDASLGGDLSKWENAFSRLMAIAEQYPDLKLSENFRTFMDAILEFEGIIAELRMTYNTSVNEYSTTKDQIPGCVYAFMFQFKDFLYFQVDEDAKGFITIE